MKPKTDAQIMREVIEGRNSKPTIAEQLEDAFGDDPIEPQHYRKGEVDLYEAAYRTRPFNEFRAIMEFVAERYLKRDKDNRLEDLEKAIYTINRLKEYEEMEK